MIEADPRRLQAWRARPSHAALAVFLLSLGVLMMVMAQALVLAGIFLIFAVCVLSGLAFLYLRQQERAKTTGPADAAPGEVP